ncbi:MAG: hypothetical protein U0R77_12270 [Mycolicibacterium insubricum]|nr:hypothetical protein [Mycobacterium sp.]
MKTLNIAAATVLGIGVGLGAGVLVKAPEAQAGLPPGTYWCWSHLVPNYQKCPDIPPWGSRWKACGSNPVLFVLYDTMCPAVPPGPDNWLPCPNLDHDVYTLDGDCAR